jgi:nucleotide-binding universal stress UspA family protein
MVRAGIGRRDRPESPPGAQRLDGRARRAIGSCVDEQETLSRPEGPARSGPVLIGIDGTNDAPRVLGEAAALLAEARVLLVVVCKPGLAFEMIELPASSIGLPPSPLDTGTALEVERSIREGAERALERSAEIARELGLDPETQVIEDEPEVPIGESLVREARRRDSRAMVVGTHARGRVLGTTTRDVVRDAPCPVLIVHLQAG